MDLNAPLGTKAPRPRRRARTVLVGAAVTLALAGIGALLATADPHGGEPYAVATLPSVAQPPAVPAAPSPADPTPTGSLPPASSPSLPRAAETGGGPSSAQRGAQPGTAGAYAEGMVENGVRVFRGTTPAPVQGPLVIDVTRQLGPPPKERPSSTDRSPDRSDPPGSGPNQPVNGLPKVAIFVGGMGLSPAATQTAIDSMPPAVTLAFVPYGSALPATVAAAVAKGHEVLLQLPMQNTGGGSPGPHALRPDEPAEALADDLGWLLGRFTGYSGLTNLLGAPVTGDAATMAGVLKAAAGRGLFFVEDGTSSRSLALDIAARQRVAAVRADVVLDATADPEAVRANFNRLVEIARRKGSAVGMASGLPEHLPVIARLAAELPGKNISLVPVGMLARGGASIATISR